jgi:hypothetical protein
MMCCRAAHTNFTSNKEIVVFCYNGEANQPFAQLLKTVRAWLYRVDISGAREAVALPWYYCSAVGIAAAIMDPIVKDLRLSHDGGDIN